ncbi:hypothetical protein HY636_03245 [Candidatus Woesearchaeota archaeon]|nr:hypothetical protein [Candidatus Woesearchaeota archaeon]
MVKFLTFLRPERTLEARLNSMISAVIWDYNERTGDAEDNINADDGTNADDNTHINGSTSEIENIRKIGSPEVTVLRHEHRIPTRLSRTNTRNELQKSVDVYREHVRKTYQAVLDETLAEISYSRNKKIAKKERAKKGGISKKLAALERKKEVLEEFLTDIDNRIRLEGPYSRGNYNTFHLVVPFLDSSEQQIYLTKEFLVDSRYNSVRRIQGYCFRFPFGIVEFNEDNNVVGDVAAGSQRNSKTIAKKQRVHVEPVLKAKGLANDIETHNWQKVRVQEELANEPEDSLKKRFLDLVDAYKTPFDTRELEIMDRRDYIRGIENILDANKDERITADSLINLDADSGRDENYVVTSLDCGMEFIDVKIPQRLDKYVGDGAGDSAEKIGNSRRIKIIKAERKKIIPAVNGLFAEINPLFCYGHNQLKFDYEKSESLEGGFTPGVGGASPLFLAQIPGGFKVLRILPGRIDIDPSGYAQHYMNLHNNKLDTVFTHVTGISSPKTMTHDELALKTRKAEEGSVQDAFDILYYAAQDSMKSYMIGEALKEEHVLLSHVFCSLPARIDVTSKKTLGEDYWVGWNLRHKQTFPRDEIRTSRITVVKRYEYGEENKSENKQEVKQEKKKEEKQEKRVGVKLNEVSFEDFNKTDYFHDELQKIAREHENSEDLLIKKIKTSEKQPNKNLNAKKGIYDGILVYFFPFAEAFRGMFVNEEEVIAVYNCVDSISLDSLSYTLSEPIYNQSDAISEANMQTTNAIISAELLNARKKVRLLKAVEAICEYPLFKMIDCMETETLFAAEFDLGFSEKELETYRARVKDAIAKIGKLLKAYKPINMKQEMFVLPANIRTNTLDNTHHDTCDNAHDNANDNANDNAHDNASDNTFDKALEKIIDDKLGVIVGRGRVLSGTKGRFACCINGEFVMHGIADYASNKGEKCVFEKAFYEYFLKKIVVEGDIRGALTYLVEKARLLADGKIMHEEIEYKREAKRDHTDYSARATQRYIPRMAEAQTRKSEMLKYDYNLEEMQEKFFGLPTKEQQEQLARYDAQHRALHRAQHKSSRQLSLFDDAKITTDANTTTGDYDINDGEVGEGVDGGDGVEGNAEKPNQRAGTISEIVEWVFKFKKGSHGRRLLDKVYKGEGTNDDVNVLMSLYNTYKP